MTELETLITQSLPRFADENPLYYKPETLADWENTWDFGEYDANIYNLNRSSTFIFLKKVIHYLYNESIV